MHFFFFFFCDRLPSEKGQTLKSTQNKGSRQLTCSLSFSPSSVNRLPGEKGQTLKSMQNKGSRQLMCSPCVLEGVGTTGELKVHLLKKNLYKNPTF